MTGSIEAAMDETNRRRRKQLAHNLKHGITPVSIKKKIMALLPEELLEDVGSDLVTKPGGEGFTRQELEEVMWKAVERLDFEKAAAIRDILHGEKGGEVSRAAMDRSKGRKTAQSQKHRRRHS